MSPSQNSPAPHPLEKRFVGYLILTVLLVTSLPYLLGYIGSGPQLRFVGQAYNIDDYCVYLSWARQAADGNFFIKDLFTTEPQNSLEFNVFFLAIGAVVRLTHLPIDIVFQIIRLAGGGFLIWLIHRLFLVCVPESAAVRMTALSLTALGTGFAWVQWPKWADKNKGQLLVDAWQPEAFTFQSIAMSFLFVASTILIVAILYNLILGEKTGRNKYAVYAGLCGLALANIHSYDVLHAAGAWGLFLVARGIFEKRLDGGAWIRAVIVGLITLPAMVYQVLVFEFFEKLIIETRHASPTPSSAIGYYVFGYGLVFFLALAAIALLIAKRSKDRPIGFADRNTALFVVCWAVAGLAIIYAPVAFQRKMIMGEDIPLSLLAGAAAVWVVRTLRPRVRVLALAAIVAATLPTSILWIWREFNHVRRGVSETQTLPYLNADDVGVLDWLRNHSRPDQVILGFPDLMIFVPGYCDRTVYVGHWDETLFYSRKLSEFINFASTYATSDDRYQFLQDKHISLLCYLNDIDAFNSSLPEGKGPLAPLVQEKPSFLVPLYRNKTYTVFGVRATSSAGIP